MGFVFAGMSGLERVRAGMRGVITMPPLHLSIEIRTPPQLVMAGLVPATHEHGLGIGEVYVFLLFNVTGGTGLTKGSHAEARSRGGNTKCHPRRAASSRHGAIAAAYSRTRVVETCEVLQSCFVFHLRPRKRCNHLGPFPSPRIKSGVGR
jgi:hypothetical protein